MCFLVQMLILLGDFWSRNSGAEVSMIEAYGVRFRIWVGTWLLQGPFPEAPYILP